MARSRPILSVRRMTNLRMAVAETTPILPMIPGRNRIISTEISPIIPGALRDNGMKTEHLFEKSPDLAKRSGDFSRSKIHENIVKNYI